jgi:hypothetical protein
MLARELRLGDEVIERVTEEHMKPVLTGNTICALLGAPLQAQTPAKRPWSRGYAIQAQVNEREDYSRFIWKLLRTDIRKADCRRSWVRVLHLDTEDANATFWTNLPRISKTKVDDVRRPVRVDSYAPTSTITTI